METVCYMDETIKKKMVLGYMRASLKAQRVLDAKVDKYEEMRRVVSVGLFMESSCEFLTYREEEYKKQYRVHKILARKAVQ